MIATGRKCTFILRKKIVYIIIAFQKANSFTKLYNYSNTCLAHGSKEELLEMYAIDVAKEQKELSSYFFTILNIVTKKREMIDWI